MLFYPEKNLNYLLKMLLIIFLNVFNNLLFKLWIRSLCVHFKTKTKKVRGFYEIKL